MVRAVAKRKSARRGKGEGSIFPAADGTWRGFITVGYTGDGKQMKKWRRGRTRREVVEKLNKIAALSGSRLVSAPERVTLEGWLTRYAMLRGDEVRASTRATYEYYIGKIVPEVGHVQLGKLTALEIRTLYSKFVAAGLSPSVRKHLHHFLKKAMKDAVRHELVERNVLELVDTPKGGNVVEPTSWQQHEIEAFLQAASGERLFGAFYLMLSQGLRMGETLALRWSDLEGNKLHIRRTVSYLHNQPVFGPPKTRRGHRTLYVSGDVLAVLVERRERLVMEREVANCWEENDLIFSSEVGTIMSPHNLRRAYRRIVTRAGVRRIRIHDLRHTYITLARDAGVDAEVVAQRAGQDVRVTLSIYSKVTEDRKRKAALSLDELMGPKAGTLTAPTEAHNEPATSNSGQLEPCKAPVLQGISDSGRLFPTGEKWSLQAGGRRFESGRLHQVTDEENGGLRGLPIRPLGWHYSLITATAELVWRAVLPCSQPLRSGSAPIVSSLSWSSPAPSASPAVSSSMPSSLSRLTAALRRCSSNMWL